MKKRVVVCFLTCILLLLCACGKRGDPYVPQGVEDQYPGQYPQDYE
jgi:hypothetical protein